MWPIQLASFRLIVCTMFLSLLQHFFIFHTIGPTHLPHPFPVPHIKTFQVFLMYFPNCPSFSNIQSCAPNVVLSFNKIEINFSLCGVKANCIDLCS
jgi:hypothetical protein